MNTIEKLSDIASRLDHLETAAEWIARETVNTDTPLSQTGSLIIALADDIRDKLVRLVTDMERGIELEKLN